MTSEPSAPPRCNPPASSVLHLDVERATKGRWIAASRARGQKLADWVRAALDAAAARDLTENQDWDNRFNR